MSKHFLDELNPVQREAATHTEGPLMIIAGAGSGKTRVLTYRIAYLMEKGADPFNILALTFTNKAAREMKNRIGKIINESSAKTLWMGTFHSIFARILRFEAEKLGYPKNFTIYDTDDSKSLIKEILKTFNLDDKIYKPSLVLNRISSAKNNLISYKQYLTNPTILSDDRASQKPMIGQIYEAYQKRLFRSGAMDFDDLLFNTNVLLRDYPDVLIKYQDKFKYILVDEYQDTNFSQYVIVKQLAARHENICVVGDDAQSIYSFRGANIQNILNFEKDYPDVKKLFLEQNYRSTQNIVNAANSVISNNKDQFEKNVWTENPAGEKIKVMRAASDSEEGYKVANSIFNIKMNKQRQNSAFAILYRTNAQSRSMEEALRKLNIPYRIYGGLSFYQRKEIKDVLAYFRLAINTNDDEAIRRVINYPARGIGQTTIDKISVLATDNDVSIFTVLDNLQDFNPDVNAGTATKLGDFAAMIKSFGHMASGTDAYETANHIIKHTGILREINKDKTPEEISRVENVEELLAAVKEFCETERTVQDEELKEEIVVNKTENPEDLFATEKDTQTKTLDEFVRDIALLTDVDRDKEDDGQDVNKVSLMTIHAAKGLEFPYVYVVGMEENLFPSQMVLQSRDELEEERRLFYVALTRAEKQAFLSFAERRFRYGNHVFCEPSRFIDEIDVKYIDFPDALEEKPDRIVDFNPEKGFYQKKGSSNIDLMKPRQASPALKRNLVSTNKATSQAAPVDIDAMKNIKEGTVVQHDKFGNGKVIALDGAFPNIKATILFDNAGQKQVLLKYARLKVIG
ncbi:MAG TPA: UvrD-helicase domain-containing protein [Bacteroidia bacterium]|nr:UvrD-helicase domain-containing protein [Bacteroidia bacterium]